MKKRRSWKFSPGGGSLFFVLLLAPLFVGLVRRWPVGGASQWWEGVLFLALLLFLAALVWFISLRRLLAQRLWALPRTWYEACLGIGFLYSFFALFIFVTGYTPSKYNSHPVPRATGFIYLHWAVLPLIVGSAVYLYAKFSRPKKGP